jgi:dTDP-4-amino-4,6-dideoxygalactose transaminase
MFNLAPNPKNRLYTNLNSYLLFLNAFFGRKSQQDRREIELFEKVLRERFNTKYAVCVYQCRVGIYLAVKALIKPGQEVILSPYTIIDVINMVIFAGGRPVFADVEHQTCNISASEVERLITPNTGAVLITHLHGLAAEAHRIKEICDLHNIPMIEDAAQSFGVKEQGKPVGTIGDVGVFSFEMHKNIPTWLGGLVVSDRQDIIEKICAELKEFSNPPLPGIAQKVKKGLIQDLASLPVIFQLFTYPIVRFSYFNSIEFINSKVRRKPQTSKLAKELPDVYKSQYTSFQAQLGLSQLNYVDRDIKTRIEYANIYHEGLKDIEGLVLPPLRSDGSHTYLWFPILCPNREDLVRFMMEKGRHIGAGHFTSATTSEELAEFYRDCPNAEKVAQEVVYLPTYPSYSRREVEKNVEVIRQYFTSKMPIQQELFASPKELAYESAKP